MTDYQTNAREVFAALLTDPDKAAKLVMDVADEQVNLGRMEALADTVKPMIAPYLANALRALHAKLEAATITAEA